MIAGLALIAVGAIGYAIAALARSGAGLIASVVMVMLGMGLLLESLMQGR